MEDCCAAMLLVQKFKVDKKIEPAKPKSKFKFRLHPLTGFDGSDFYLILNTVLLVNIVFSMS